MASESQAAALQLPLRIVCLWRFHSSGAPNFAQRRAVPARRRGLSVGESLRRGTSDSPHARHSRAEVFARPVKSSQILHSK